MFLLHSVAPKITDGTGCPSDSGCPLLDASAARLRDAGTANQLINACTGRWSIPVMRTMTAETLGKPDGETYQRALDMELSPRACQVIKVVNKYPITEPV